MNAVPTLMNDPAWSSKWDYRKDLREVVAHPTGAQVLEATLMPVWLFVSSNGARITSRPPVEVEVYKEGPDSESPNQAFIFACKKLHVYASASTYKEAEDLFHDQIVHFFYVYRDIHADQLDEDAAAIQSLYHRHFQESSPPVR